MKRLRSWLLLVLAALVVGLFFFLPDLLDLGPDHGSRVSLDEQVPQDQSSPASNTEMAHHHHGQSSSDDGVAAPVPGCVLKHGQCTLEVSQGKHMRVSIDPLPIPTMEPIRLRVELQGLEAGQVRIKIQGRDMYMGEQQVSLAQRRPDVFEGELIIPACSTGHAMVWRAQVEAGAPEDDYQGLFEFTAGP